MNLLYPLGLLALIAVPVLVIIYIIKNKYTEQVITTTYLWTLSEKFLKRKNPLKRITGILSLILQILVVVLIAMSLTQPSFTLVGAAHDYLFVLDGSGSMNIASSSGTTRLDSAKEQVKDIVSSAADGSTFTIVYSSDSVYTVCDSVTDKGRISTYLSQIDEGYCASNLTAALTAAQQRFTENPSLKVYLFTDKSYDASSGNFTLVNLSSGEENYAVSDIEYTLSDSKLTVTGNAWSYESDASLTISLYLDGSDTADSTQTVAASKLAASAFEFESDTVNFTSFTVKVEEADSLLPDNECVVYTLKSDSTYNTLIITDSSVSDNTFFLKAALTSLGGVQVTTMDYADYTGASGYGLYIFDSCTPTALPTDGAVWFVNPCGSVANSGFTYQTGVTLSYHGTMEFSTSTSSRVQSLLEGTVQSGIYLKQYSKCSFSKSFYTLLSYNSDPLLFAGTNSYGNREVVFAFDFHETDFALCADYIPLMANLFGYTFPEIVEDTLYYCGDTVEVNVLANCTSIRVDTPLGNISYLDVSSDVAEYTVTEAGTYTITLMVGGSQRQVYIYASIPLEERYTSVYMTADGALYTYGANGSAVDITGADGTVVTETVFSLSGEAENGSRDGTFSELWVWLVVLAVLFIADWGVYCYEQYQLR